MADENLNEVLSAQVPYLVGDDRHELEEDTLLQHGPHAKSAHHAPRQLRHKFKVIEATKAHAKTTFVSKGEDDFPPQHRQYTMLQKIEFMSYVLMVMIKGETALKAKYPYGKLRYLQTILIYWEDRTRFRELFFSTYMLEQV